ncbi:MAG: BON domain-containing protein [Thermomicrobiales bacterium]|nr:BON domain-containing protein [Thermomicrobiales bacterium]
MNEQSAASDQAGTLADRLREITVTLEDAGIFVGVEVDGDQIVLEGEVDSEENRQAALDVTRAALVGLRYRLVDAIIIIEYAPDTPFETGERLTTDEYWGLQPRNAPRDPNRTAMEFDPDFSEAGGPADPEISVAEAVPYSPPTDPVVTPVGEPRELHVLGGFSETSMDDPAVTEEGQLRGDVEIAEDIARELREDAATTDLVIGVTVREGRATLRGEVPTLEDAENAEAVAARVAGVLEVREELHIAGLERR